MNYLDNARPKAQFWFSPMAVLDFLDNYNRPAVVLGHRHQAAKRGCKIGVQAAILDIKKTPQRLRLPDVL